MGHKVALVGLVDVWHQVVSVVGKKVAISSSGKTVIQEPLLGHRRAHFKESVEGKEVKRGRERSGR